MFLPRKWEHMLILGSTGVGKSLNANSNIYFKENGAIKRSKINKILNKKNIQVLCLNTKTHKYEWGNVIGFLKHKSKNLLKITLETGNEITITKDHSLLTMKDGEIVSIAYPDLNTRTFVPTLRSLDWKSQKFSIDLTDFVNIDFIDGDVISKLLNEYKNIPYGQKGDYLKKHNILRETFQNWKTKHRRVPQKEFIYPTRSGSVALKKQVSLDEDFGYLIGIYLSEGNICYGDSSVNITNSNTDVLNKTKKTIRKLGINYNINRRNGSEVIRINNKLFSNFLKNTCKNGSKNKIMPDFVFFSNKKFIKGIISGLFDGDGHISKKNVNICSKSKKLLLTLQELLTHFDVRTTLRSTWKTYSKEVPKRKYWRLNIIFSSIPNFSNLVDFQIQYKKDGLQKLLFNRENRKRWSKYDLIVNFGDVLVDICNENHLSRRFEGFRPMYKNFKTFTKRQYAGRHTLQKAVTRIEERNPEGLEKIKTLLMSDVYWDRISKIQELKGEQDVYDIEVEGHNNFIANNIFVHNSSVGELMCEIMYKNKGAKIIDLQNNKYVEAVSFMTPNKNPKFLANMRPYGIQPQSFPTEIYHPITPSLPKTLPGVFRLFSLPVDFFGYEEVLRVLTNDSLSDGAYVSLTQEIEKIGDDDSFPAIPSKIIESMGQKILKTKGMDTPLYYAFDSTKSSSGANRPLLKVKNLGIFSSKNHDYCLSDKNIFMMLKDTETITAFSTRWISPKFRKVKLAINLYLLMKIRDIAKRTRNTTIVYVREARELFPNPRTSDKAMKVLGEMAEAMIKDCRKAGIKLVLDTQSIFDLPPEVADQASYRVIFRHDRRESDILDMFLSSPGLDRERIKNIKKLRNYRFYVSYPGFPPSKNRFNGLTLDYKLSGHLEERENELTVIKKAYPKGEWFETNDYLQSIKDDWMQTYVKYGGKYTHKYKRDQLKLKAKAVGVTENQYKMLKFIYENRDENIFSFTDLARRAGLAKGSAADVLDRLFEMGFIMREGDEGSRVKGKVIILESALSFVEDHKFKFDLDEAESVKETNEVKTGTSFDDSDDVIYEAIQEAKKDVTTVE